MANCRGPVSIVKRCEDRNLFTARGDLKVFYGAGKKVSGVVAVGARRVCPQVHRLLLLHEALRRFRASSFELCLKRFDDFVVHFLAW